MQRTYLGHPHCGVEKWYLVGLGLRNLFIDRMSTKLKGDLAEQAASLKALELGWEVLRPLGDRLPYDLVLDVEGRLVKVQVKAAYLEAKSGNYVVDTRRTKTNRRVMVRARYAAADFDFAVCYIDDLRVFHVFPITVFMSYASGISLVEDAGRQRAARARPFRDAWQQIADWAPRQETVGWSPVKFGEASARRGGGDPEPSLVLGPSRSRKV